MLCIAAAIVKCIGLSFVFSVHPMQCLKFGPRHRPCPMFIHDCVHLGVVCIVYADAQTASAIRAAVTWSRRSATKRAAARREEHVVKVLEWNTAVQHTARCSSRRTRLSLCTFDPLDRMMRSCIYLQTLFIARLTQARLWSGLKIQDQI